MLMLTVHPHLTFIVKKKPCYTITKGGEDTVEKEQHTVGGKVIYRSHYGYQYDGSSKNLK
jgi:hypothetical protein